MSESAVKLRNAIKAKKPAFVRQDSWKLKTLKKAWRKPKGIHSKIRHRFKGNERMPSQGYRSPKEARGLHPTGKKPVLILTPKQLDRITDEGIIIAAVGDKKKLEIAKKAIEKKLQVLNADPAKLIQRIQEKLKERIAKKTQQKQTQAKQEAKKEPEKKEATEEEKRKEATKEMEKVITQRV